MRERESELANWIYNWSRDEYQQAFTQIYLQCRLCRTFTRIVRYKSLYFEQDKNRKMIERKMENVRNILYKWLSLPDVQYILLIWHLAILKWIGTADTWGSAMQCTCSHHFVVICGSLRFKLYVKRKSNSMNIRQNTFQANYARFYFN